MPLFDTAEITSTDVNEREKIRKILLDEVNLKIKLDLDGIRYDPETIKKFAPSVRGRETFGGRFGSFYLPHGVTAHGKPNRWSRYSLVEEDNEPVLFDNENDTRIGSIRFHQRHPVLDQTISSGEKFSDIASVNPEGGMRVQYSNECALKDLGEDCLYCGFNVRAQKGVSDRVPFKSPRQIAEAYDLARKADTGNHLNLTGGFVPERRELEYYLDVLDGLHEIAGYKKINIVTVIGAPADLSVLDKYKEAGVTTININIEIWDKNIFRAICPGKDKRNGGWRHWLDALEYSAEVFGKGNTQTNLVAGLEPKQSVLEGVEYLASKGIVCKFGSFNPVPGTPLEGYRTPDADWHWDLALKGAEIYKRYGFTTDDLYKGAVPGRPVFDIFRINAGEFVGDQLPQWKFPSLGETGQENEAIIVGQ
jgi:hypothetical protein